MKKPGAQDKPQQENPYGLIGKIYEGNRKSHQSRLLSLYIGGALIITFLFMASLAPQIGERLGNLAVKKQTQESRAATAAPVIPSPRPSSDLYPQATPQATQSSQPIRSPAK